MSIEDLTIAEARQKIAEAQELRELFTGQTPVADAAVGWEIGSNYFVRTVTHHIMGKLIAVTDKELVMEDVSWIADDGRFSEMFISGTVNEVEPAPEGLAMIGRGALIDAYVWPHALLRVVK